MQVKSNLQYQESIRSPEQGRIPYLKALNDESIVKMTAIFAVWLVVTVLLVGFAIGHEISRRHKQEQLPDKSKQSPQQEQLHCVGNRESLHRLIL
jgi:heme/copper-type cytochrome/quinol oxidase subunit 2